MGLLGRLQVIGTGGALMELHPITGPAGCSGLVMAGELTVEEADAIQNGSRTEYRFALPDVGFRDLVYG